MADDAIIFTPDPTNARAFYAARAAEAGPKLEWWPAWVVAAKSGDLALSTGPSFFDGKPGPATRGVARKLLAGVEPFPFDRLKPYDTSYLSGFTVEHYQVVLFDAADQARAAMVNELRAMCSREVPGDTQRNLQIRPEFSGQTFKHLLAPVWLLRYDYGPRSFQVVVNGATGRIAGDYPKSAWKILLLILAVLAALAVLLLLAQGG